ncbi:MAG: FAD-dependent oxidoreductase [Syntrophales bacterium]|jgi:NAD(P)H-nitrite reductase large subunit|nr:FAD-dependent oxidoreductase [Syntrophales bacterium]
MSFKKRIVIIGNSAAGLSALEAFRRLDVESKVAMIDREPVRAYSRVITPYYIKGLIQKEEGLFIRTEQFYRDHAARTIFGASVEAIDTRNREVILDTGLKEPFDVLLIATGAFPNRPPIEQDTPDTRLVLRTLADAEQLKERRRSANRGLFLGAGLVTLQTLQAMHKDGADFTLVIKSDRVLSQTLDAEAAEIVERRLEAMKIRIVKGQDILRVKKTGHSQTATLSDGGELPTDFLFVGKGVDPSIAFLAGSGIRVGRGILVDSHMETNVEGIYAAGDVAQAPDFFSGKNVVAGLWPAAVEQGECAGKNMAGVHSCYGGNLKKNVSRIFGIPLVSIGDFTSKEVHESLVVRQEGRDVYRRFCFDRSGTLIGAVLVNRVDDLGVIHGLIKSRKGIGGPESLSGCSHSLSYGTHYFHSVKPQFGWLG